MKNPEETTLERLARLCAATPEGIIAHEVAELVRDGLDVELALEAVLGPGPYEGAMDPVWETLRRTEAAAKGRARLRPCGPAHQFDEEKDSSGFLTPPGHPTPQE